MQKSKFEEMGQDYRALVEEYTYEPSRPWTLSCISKRTDHWEFACDLCSTETSEYAYRLERDGECINMCGSGCPGISLQMTISGDEDETSLIYMTISKDPHYDWAEYERWKASTAVPDPAPGWLGPDHEPKPEYDDRDDDFRYWSPSSPSPVVELDRMFT